MRTEAPARIASVILLVLVPFALAGCGNERTDPGVAPAAVSAEQPPSGYEPVARTVDWKQDVQLVRVTHDQWRRELDALEGNVLVVDLWATWCAPCIERFPAMLELAREWGPRGVTFVSLSLDDRDDPDSVAQVREFLREKDARIPNYLMDEIIPDAFEKLGLLGIPAVYVYDADGTRTHRLTGDDPNRQFTEADVEAAVRSLVGDQA
jgi:thiol-disulfide isomerase/thioredoxin